MSKADDKDELPDDVDEAQAADAEEAAELSSSLLDDDDEDAEQSDSINVIPTATTLDEPIPALREVRAQLVNVNESSDKEKGDEPETVVLLEDPEGLAPKAAALSPWAFKLATLFDGQRSAKDAVKEFEARYGQGVPAEQALSLQNELDKAMFLYSRRFERALKRHIRGYLDKEVRAAVHAGTSYATDPEAARETVRGFFSSPDGPGSLDDLAEGEIGKTHEVLAAMLPHIELTQGGATYAHGYYELLKKSQAEVFFILGVAHQALSDGLYYVSTKDFATSLGVLKTNKPIARRLQTAASVEGPVAELAHRTEHSVEFQALLLQVMAEKAKRDVEIVPVLCGSLEQYILQKVDPLQAPEFVVFTERLRKELDNCKKKWCVLCSVDMSHVGPEFNHSTMIDEKLLLPVERGDRRLLKKLEELDLEGFYNEIFRTENSRHVDAVLAMMTMLKATEGLLKKGKLLHYDQLLKNGSHSAVSFASMAFTK
ncbi:MAG TPA: AmmeMemoRadiSam system protein B [Planctomycetota bacterium]|nr:AmmeMemoRadiSam system protein B [Planctomycetota bacterium]